MTGWGVFVMSRPAGGWGVSTTGGPAGGWGGTWAEEVEKRFEMDWREIFSDWSSEPTALT